MRFFHRALTLSICGLALTVCSLGHSFEIEKKGAMGEKGIDLFWWPKLNVPTGWVHNDDQSMDMRSNVLIPMGKTFNNAETVIYARAFYAPDKKKRETLQQFIDDDIKGMVKHSPKTKVVEIAGLKTSNGKALRTYSFTNPGKTFEQACYGLEGDFWIEFVVSSQSAKGLKSTLPVFTQLLRDYR